MLRFLLKASLSYGGINFAGDLTLCGIVCCCLEGLSGAIINNFWHLQNDMNEQQWFQESHPLAIRLPFSLEFKKMGNGLILTRRLNNIHNEIWGLEHYHVVSSFSYL